MIDIGVSYKEVKEYLYDIKYLLITHIHSDHVKPSTLNRIKKEFPKITVIGNYEIAQKFGVDIVCNANFEVETEDYTFLPFDAVHDVICYGYTWKVDGMNIIYCTDTNTLEYAPDLKYDYLFLESNYDKVKLEQVKFSRKIGYDAYGSSLGRHLSTKASRDFYFLHRKSRESKWIELHKSERFY
jgi:phosphoribosyl 1,2-cyclic phosphodiesterase